MQETATTDPIVLAEPEGSHVMLAELSSGQAAMCIVRSPVKETSNEDVAAVIPLGDDADLLCIADGCGGHSGGAEAARLAIKAMRAVVKKHLDEESDAIDRRAVILRGFDEANRAVMDMGVGAACTMAAVETHAGSMRSYHAGDSQVLAIGQRGRVRVQTVAHSPVGYGVEAGLIDQQDALHHDDRHLVSNLVGAPDMRIEMGPRVMLSSRDTVLVASDGLFDNLRVEEIIAIIRKGPLGEAATALLEMVNRRMTNPAPGEPSKPDDLSFVLYRLPR